MIPVISNTFEGIFSGKFIITVYHRYWAELFIDKSKFYSGGNKM